MTERVDLSQSPSGLPYAGSPTVEDYEVAKRVRAEVKRWTYKPGWAFTVTTPARDLVVIHVDVELEGLVGQIAYHNAYAIVMISLPRWQISTFGDILRRLINETERKHSELWLVQAPLPEVQI
jgi:hypothetical protein